MRFFVDHFFIIDFFFGIGYYSKVKFIDILHLNFPKAKSRFHASPYRYKFKDFLRPTNNWLFKYSSHSYMKKTLMARVKVGQASVKFNSGDTTVLT